MNGNESNKMALADEESGEGDASHDETTNALRQRPTISISTRIVVAFSLCFALTAAIVIWSIWMLLEFEDRIRFFESADSYLAEIHQARRFEKNYLLYGTNLDDALEHTANARRILAEKGETIERILTREHFSTMNDQLDEYQALLARLAKSGAEVKRDDIERALREIGGQMVAFAGDFVKKERDTVDRMLSLARRVPFYFLGVLLALIVFVAASLTRNLLVALKRFTEYTVRVGEGDFSPITPARKYRDEFSKLAEAFNRMIRELDRRHKILVESHKLRAIGTLVAGVAHELNNPLNNTMLTAAVLREDFGTLTDEEKLEMIDDITVETERSQRIVRNLLDFARESEVSVQPLQIDSIVEDSIRLVANQVRMAKVRLETDFASDLPPVHGDEQMLKQVFVNLILNAVDVLDPRGHILVSIRREPGGEFIAVEVRDSGPGIPEHIQTRIFEPFYTTKSRGHGTGLGLSVSRGIVRKLGGYIRVVSKVGLGSSFTVFLPTTEMPSLISSG